MFECDLSFVLLKFRRKLLPQLVLARLKLRLCQGLQTPNRVLDLCKVIMDAIDYSLRGLSIIILICLQFVEGRLVILV